MTGQPTSRIYTVVIHPAEEGGFWTEVPILGIGSQGETIQEALEMTWEAIELMVCSLEEDGLPVPLDVIASRETLQVAVPA